MKQETIKRNIICILLKWLQKYTQKKLVINLFGYFSAMLSSYILLNINVYIALLIIVITLTFSVINEIRLYKMKQN